MERCDETVGLEVHHKDRSAGNNLDNAQVLCQPCHKKTLSFATQGTSPPDFTEETRQAALGIAGNQCQCTRMYCHELRK